MTRQTNGFDLTGKVAIVIDDRQRTPTGANAVCRGRHRPYLRRARPRPRRPVRWFPRSPSHQLAPPRSSRD